MSAPDRRTVVAEAVTALFVPGDRPERFAKAAASGADLVVVDLEDAVADDRREQALAHVLEALEPTGGRPGFRAAVRVTDPSSPTHARELDGLAALAARPDHGLLGVVVPKAADPDALGRVVAALSAPDGGVPVVALVESAAGVLAAVALARVPGVVRLAFGALDFALDAGTEPGSETATFACAQLVLASRAAGIAGPLGSPAVEITDLGAVDRGARYARSLGFTGQLCIHPAQVGVVHAAFAPTDDEQRWAQEVISSSAGGASQVAGRMIDRPVFERARIILRRAGDQR